MEATLSEAHGEAAAALGEVALALAARRVRPARLRAWASALRAAAVKIERLVPPAPAGERE